MRLTHSAWYTNYNVHGIQIYDVQYIKCTVYSVATYVVHGVHVHTAQVYIVYAMYNVYLKGKMRVRMNMNE